MTNSLSKRLQAACMALADDGCYLYQPGRLRDERCAITPPSQPALSSWWCDHRALLSLRKRGLLDVADAGGGQWKATLNKFGQEIVYIIVARNPAWLTTFTTAHECAHAEQFLDRLMLPPGPYRGMAAVLRAAHVDIQRDDQP